MKESKLHRLAAQSGDTWHDDRTWFEVERYLLAGTTRFHMQALLHLSGLEPEGAARYFKTDAVELLRSVPPTTLVEAWSRLRSPGTRG
jgi:hypothetical protein